MKNLRPAPSLLALVLVLTAALSACTSPSRSDPDDGIVENPQSTLRVLANQQEIELDALIPLLLSKRVVFIGESHDRYDHHLNQLAIIRRLHEADPAMAIGLEMFQQPYQRYLDAYIDGRIDDRELLARTGYFERWRFDYRLYQPILDYAREKGIAVIALNVPREVTRRVSEVGVAGLSREERAWVPQHIDKTDTAYRERLKQVFEAHKEMSSAQFEHFLEVQLVWDEGMAERAARYLETHPESRLVVLAGSGHLAQGSGIPQRLQRRIPVASAIVLQGDSVDTESQGADYQLISRSIELPPSGRLGVMLEKSANGMRVQSVIAESGSQKAGIRPDDRLIGIEGNEIESMEDIRLALWDKDPGEPVQVTVARVGQDGGAQELALDIVLQE